MSGVQYVGAIVLGVGVSIATGGVLVPLGIGILLVGTFVLEALS